MAVQEDKKFYFLSKDLNDIFYYPEDQNINQDFRKIINQINKNEVKLKTGVLMKIGITDNGVRIVTGYFMRHIYDIKEITEEYIITNIDDVYINREKIYFAIPIFGYNDDLSINSLLFVVLVTVCDNITKPLSHLTKIKTKSMFDHIVNKRVEDLNALSEINLFDTTKLK